MLSLRGLTHHYPRGPTLAFPDFDAPAGARVVISGPSGSGKSTLIALCAGLLSAQGGAVQVAGTELSALAPSQRDAWRGATLGIVPQRLHLSPSLTVFENVALPFVSVGLPIDRQRVTALLERLDVAALRGRRPHQLSVGQAQRVALARALVRRPALLLVDEPTAHLDDEATAAALKLLDETASAADATLLVASHDQRVVHALPFALDWRLERVVECAA